MESIVCVTCAFFIASPILVFIVKDIKPFINEIKSNNKKSSNSIQSDQTLLIPTIDSIEQHDNINSIQLKPLKIQEPKEFQQPNEIKQIHSLLSIQVLLEPLNIVIWISVLLFGYILARLIVEISDYRRNFKYTGAHFQDVLDLCIRSFLIYIIGNICKRFETNRMKIEFIICITYFLIVYLFTFEECPNITLTSDGNGIGTTNIIIVVLLLFMFVIIGLYVMIRNIYCSFYYVKRKLYWCFIICVVLFNICMIIFGSTNEVNIHIHHHYWSFLLAMLCRADNRISFVTQTFLIAVMIHGFAVFGCQELYAWRNVKQEHFDNMCYEFQCEIYQCSLPQTQ